MTHPPVAGSTRRDEQTVSADNEIAALLGTLEDPDCRSIIEATRTSARSASELSEECELPLSTTYRKLEQLTEVGLLEERIRLSKSGQHTSEYLLKVDSIEFSVDSEAGIQLSISTESPAQSENSIAAGAD